MSSPREREKRDRRESRGDEREGQGRKRNRNESEETEEITRAVGGQRARLLGTFYIVTFLSLSHII